MPRFAAALLLLALPCARAQTPLNAPSLPDGAHFGAALAGTAACDGSSRAVVYVGAPGTGALAGSVVAFQSTEGWSVARLDVAPGSAAGDRFGASVAARACEFGGVLVGAPGAGRAFHYVAQSFAPPPRLGPAPLRLDGFSLGAGSAFGSSVEGIGGALSVGAPAAAGGAGRVLVFPEYGTGGPAVVAPSQTLAPSDPADRGFGAALAHAYTGTVLPGDVNNARLVVSAPGGATGAVYVYSLRGAAAFTLRARLSGPPGFGSAVAISDRLAVSSPQTGEVYLFREAAGGTWLPDGVVAAPSGVPDGHFGADALAFYNAGGSRPGLLVSAAAPESAAEARAPVAFLPGPDGYAARAVPTAGTAPSGRYGAALSVWSNGAASVATGDPGAGPGGAAFVAPAGVLPVSGERALASFALAVRAFPSPADVRATLSVSIPAEVRVVDVLGREVLRTATTQPEQQVALDTSRLPSGIYVVLASAGRSTATVRFVVSH